MKRWSHIACLSAAVAAVVVGGSRKSLAQTLVWDSSGSAGSGTPVDGSGIWDLSTPDWTNGTTNVVWPNDSTNPTTPVYSAQFGNDANNPANGNDTPGLNEITLGATIEVQNIDLSTGSDGSAYYIDDALGYGSLQVDGNITKSTPNGELSISLTAAPLTLPAGNHTIAINDSPGAVPELTLAANIVGAGSITQDNSQFASGSYGTLVMTGNNSYTGGTTVTSGLTIIGQATSLGSGPVTIGPVGALSVGGDGTPATTMTINNTITITRNTYTGGTNGDYGKNPDALVAANTSNPTAVITFNNLVIDSTDARIAADTSTILLPNPLIAGTDVTAGTAVADFDGDYAGYVDLNADNTSFFAGSNAGNAIAIMGGVEINAVNDAALGGSGSTLLLNGGFIHITSALLASNPAFATNFGGHTINTSAVSTGVDIDSGLTFNVSNLSGGGVGERGTGILNFSGTNNFSSGNPFFDGGTINFLSGSSTSQGSIGVRSAIVNVAGALILGANTDSIGDSSTGTNGGPDIATINIATTGSVIETGGGAFDISNSANTQGTINMTGNAVLTTIGNTWLGKSSGAVGTINQTNGALTISHSGNFGFVIGDGRADAVSATGATGYYNLSAGTFTDPNGEVYVGEGDGNASPGIGTWTQTGGTATFGSYFVVGREGAMGTLNLSSGTLSQSGTNGGVYFSIGEGINVNSAESTNVSTVTVSGTGQLTEGYGQFFVGNGNNSSGGSNSGTGILNIGTAAGATTGADAAASVTVNNWLAVGRAGTANGTINLYDGTLTQAVSNWFDISGDGGSPTGTVNVYGGTLNAFGMLVGENGSGHGTLNIDGGNVNLPNITVLANSGTVTGTINLNGGTLTSYSIEAHNADLGEGAGTGAAILDFNGGTLVASQATGSTALVGAKVTSIVSAGGAIINTNNFASTITTTLTHDSTLSGADGGLTKLGLGTLTASGNNTYTGPTIVKTGTLDFTGTPVLANGEPLNLAGGGATIILAHGLTGYLADIQAAYDNGAWDGTSSTTPYITSSYAATHPGVGVGYAVSGSALTLMTTWYGDTGLTGTVTYAEINAITPLASGGTWATGDFNYDGKVNADDISLALYAVAEANGRSISSVAPEPAAFLVGLPALLALTSRRSRRRGA